MPLEVLTPEQKDAGLKALEPALRLLLAERKVPVPVQEVLGHYGVTSIEVLAKVESDENAVRRWIKDPNGLGLDEPGTASRVTVSTLLVVWDACRDRVARRSALEAEHRAAGRAPGVMKGDLLTVRRAYENARGELRDEDAPGKGYLELKLEEFNEGEIAAEHLSEVTAVSDEKKAPAAGGTVDLRWDNVLQLRTGKHTVQVPRTPEEYRSRIRLMRTLWSYLKLKGIAPQLLADYDGSAWDTFVEYVLGPQGWGLQTQDANGQVVAAPSWKGILHWEHELRREAAKKMNRGTPFGQALREATKDTELRMRYLLQPIAVSAAAEAFTRSGLGSASLPPGTETGYEPALKRFKGDGPKGDGKGPRKKKGDGKGPKGASPSGSGPKGGQKQEYLTTFRRHRERYPDTLRLKVGDKSLCFRYQEKKGCSKPDCPFLHVCAACGASDHGYEKPCPKTKSS